MRREQANLKESEELLRRFEHYNQVLLARESSISAAANLAKM